MKKEWIFKSRIDNLLYNFKDQVELAKRYAIEDFLNKNKNVNSFSVKFEIKSLSFADKVVILEHHMQPDLTYKFNGSGISSKELSSIIDNNTGELVAMFELED